MPSVKERVHAAGILAGLPEVLARAFAPGRGFQAIDAPMPGDWLAEHEEPGQTYDEYVRSRPNRPTDARRTIYVLPIGEPAHLDDLVDFTAAHFHPLPVKKLRGISAAATGATTRRQGDHTQMLATDVLAYLQTRVPQDAFCLIGVTDVDLYPEPQWNFVFGMASFRERVGVQSMARYHPAFFDEADHYPDPDTWVLRRSVKVMAHEIGHMFGMEHCVHYECVMNGSNHLEETDRRPAHLCPVCLRKLRHAIGFDPVERYRALGIFFSRAGLGPEADWTRARVDELTAEDPPAAPPPGPPAAPPVP